MIKHKFQLVIDGLQFADSSVTFEDVSEDFKSIQLVDLNDLDSNFEIIITNQETSTIEILKNEAKKLADEFVNRLSLIKNHEIKFFKYIGYFDKDGNFIHDQKNINITPGTGHLIRNPKKYYANIDQKNILNNEKNSGLKRVYRNTLGLTDSISKYLILYGLLQILKGNQNSVDDYIKAKIPEIPIVDLRPQVTIITKIRNMIGHPDGKWEIEELKSKVDEYLEKLRDLVVQILIQE